MAPKKAKKISLNEFLGDSALGSWADEMDSLPNAPAVRTDEENSRGDRYGRRGDDFLSSRPDRVAGPPREDIPLPSQPPYTAFIGNLAFDLTEDDLGAFFEGAKTKSIKIIKDKDDKPKGFGYVEFEDLDGLKDALTKSGSNFSGRTVRVSVAEPPKERGGFGGGFEDDSKFDNPWRRDGPLPDLPNSRDSSRRRFDGPPPDRQLSSVSEGASDWRSTRPARQSEEAPQFKRKGSGFLPPDAQAGAADKDEVWTIGGKFKPAAPGPDETPGSRFGSLRGKGDMGPPKDTDEGDWRSARPKPAHTSISPSSSTPPTPQLGRRKLELLPRSGNASASPSPLSSPKMGPTPQASSASRSNPFGAARPVDVSTREKEVADRLEKDKERLPMSRTNSRTATERSSRTSTPPANSQNKTPSSPKPSNYVLAPNVRPTLSFANVAANKETVDSKPEDSSHTTNKVQAEAVAEV